MRQFFDHFTIIFFHSSVIQKALFELKYTNRKNPVLMKHFQIIMTH
jgi:hypothetical protein